jgi:hypothetical protein
LEAIGSGPEPLLGGPQSTQPSSAGQLIGDDRESRLISQSELATTRKTRK